MENFLILDTNLSKLIGQGKPKKHWNQRGKKFSPKAVYSEFKAEKANSEEKLADQNSTSFDQRDYNFAVPHMFNDWKNKKYKNEQSLFFEFLSF